MLASTGLSIEAIQKMINKHYYSDQWTVTPDLEIHHPTIDTSTKRIVKKNTQRLWGRSKQKKSIKPIGNKQERVNLFPILLY